MVNRGVPAFYNSNTATMIKKLLDKLFFMRIIRNMLSKQARGNRKQNDIELLIK